MEWYYLNAPGWGLILLIVGTAFGLGLTFTKHIAASSKRWFRARVLSFLRNSDTHLSSDGESLFICHLVGLATRIPLSEIEGVRPYEQQRPRRICLELEIHNDWHRFGEDCADQAAPLGAWLASDMEQRLHAQERTDPEYAKQGLEVTAKKRELLERVTNEYESRTRPEAELRAEMEKIRSIRYPKGQDNP